MGASPPATVADLVERFERDRKVFLSPGYKEEQPPKTPPERGSLKRTIAAADKQTDTPVYELYGLT